MRRIHLARALPPLALCVAATVDCGSSGAKSTSSGSGAGSSAATTSGATTSNATSSGGTTSSATSGTVASGSSTSGNATSSTSAGVGGATASSTSGATSTSGSSTSTSGGTGGSPAAGKWVMGYYASWNDPVNGGNYPVSAVDWDGLTHIATAFYLPDGKGGWASGSFDTTTATALITAAHAHGKKAIASIGGADSGPMFEGSSSSANLNAFVAKLEALLTMGYDGLDIDWEGGNLTTDQDHALQSTLVQALRTESPNAIITLTAACENENILDNLSWYGTISAELDQINVMTYGMSGAYQGWKSWHSAPLHWNNVSSTPVGIDATVAHYLAAGVPAAKLGVGTGFYGECYTSPVTAPVQALNGSTVSASDGQISYANILSTYFSASAYHYDAAAESPYLTLDGKNASGCTYLTYEDPTSIAAKGAWVKAQGLGGAIIWELAEGFVPSGSNVAAQNPLVEAMKTAFLQ